MTEGLNIAHLDVRLLLAKSTYTNISLVSLQPQKYAIGYKNITANDNFFTGHFPERKIMPGILLASISHLYLAICILRYALQVCSSWCVAMEISVVSATACVPLKSKYWHRRGSAVRV